MKVFNKWTLSLGFLGAVAMFSSEAMSAGAQLNTFVCYLDVPASRQLLGEPLKAFGKTRQEAADAVVADCEALTKNTCEQYRTTNNLSCSRAAAFTK